MVDNLILDSTDKANLEKLEQVRSAVSAVLSSRFQSKIVGRGGNNRSRPVLFVFRISSQRGS